MVYVVIQAVYSKIHVQYMQTGCEAHQTPTNTTSSKEPILEADH